MFVALKAEEGAAVLKFIDELIISALPSDIACLGLRKMQEALREFGKPHRKHPFVYDLEDTFFADYLLMLAHDLDESNLPATAEDYRECARRLAK